MDDGVKQAFDEWAGHLDYPMLIVTTCDGTDRAGCLLGFSTQCSIDPARLIVFVSNKNFTYRVARNAEMLAVHVVPSDREDLARLFGEETGDEVDKFARCAWEPGPLGVPVLGGCGDRVVGRVVERFEPEGADHVGFILEPVEVTADGGTFFPFSRAQHFEPGHEA